MKTFKIITFGCRVNQAESRMMGENISKLGIASITSTTGITSKKEKADLVIINTCVVTNKAEREVRKEIRRVKRENPKCFLVATGCWINKIAFGKTNFSSVNETLRQLADQTYINTQKNYLSQYDQNRTFSLVDLWVGNKDKEKIAEIIDRVLELQSFRVLGNLYKDKYSRSKKALIKIQEGCNNFCAYCIVPYVRGRSKSRYADEIIDEINRLVKEGIEEIVLTGIDIASFKFQISNNKFQTNYKSQITKHKNNIVRLIKLILAETEIKKISFGSMGLDVFDYEFISLYK